MADDPLSRLTAGQSTTIPGSVQQYQPASQPNEAPDNTQYTYSPGVQGIFNKNDLEQAQLPKLEAGVEPHPGSAGAYLENNFFKPLFDKKFEGLPPQQIPGRENIGTAAMSEGKQFLHDMSAMGAAALNKIKHPSFGPEDADFIRHSAPYLLPEAYMAERYGRPALHLNNPEEYLDKVIFPYLKNQPIQTTLDLLPLLGEETNLLSGPLRGIIKTAEATEKGAKVLKALREVPRNIKNSALGALEKVPGIGQDIEGYNTAKYLLDKLSPADSAGLDKTERELLKAFGKIKAEDQPYISSALNRTDPKLDSLLEKPEVKAYANVQDRLSQEVYNRMLKAGIVTKEQWLASHIFPSFSAAVKRGEFPYPVSNLRSHDVYDNPTLQQAMVEYAREQIKQKGPHAFRGSYNPQTFLSDINAYEKGQIPKGKPKEVATTQRESAEVAEAHLKDKNITGIVRENHSLHAAMNMARKLDLINRFLGFYEKLEQVYFELEQLAPEARGAASAKLEKTLRPLLSQVGITMEAEQQLEQISYWAATYEGKRTLRGGLKDLMRTGADIHEGLLKILEPFASFQRAVSILADVPFPLLLHGFQWLVYGTSGLKPGNLKNFVAAARLAQNERIFQQLPSQFLEHRTPIDYNNPLLKAFSLYAEKAGYDPANKVRAASAILTMLDEYDRLHPIGRAQLLKHLTGLFDLEKDARRLLAMLRAGEKNAIGTQQLTAKIAKRMGDLFGRYKGPYGPVMRTMRATSIWFNMTNHAITLAGRIAMENPRKFMVLRAMAQQIGAHQIMDAKAANIPDWAIKLGVVPTGQKTDKGYAMVQFDSGFNLLLEAARSGLNLAEIVEHVSSPHPDEAANYIDAQTNFLLNAGLLYSGQMPYGHRPITNPYIKKIEGQPYNVLKAARKYGTTKLPTNQSIKKDVQTEPYDTFLQKAMIAAGLGLSPKKWNYLKRIDAYLNSYEYSDLTVPFTDMKYPKVDTKTGQLAPRQHMDWVDWVPGGHRVADQKIRQKGQSFNAPAEYTRKKQMSNEAKLFKAYRPLVKTKNKLLPQY